jgi:hypothetical protein
MQKLTLTELEGQTVELLPSKETLLFDFPTNWSSIYASNSSLAVSALTLGSYTSSGAWQAVLVSQVNH